MAIDNAKKYRVGREIIERLFTGGLFERIYREVKAYNQIKSKNLNAAITHLKTALDMPHRMRVRITGFMETYDGGGTTLIGECISMVMGSNITLGEINTQLTTYENYCQTRVDACPLNGNTMTWDQIANDLESQLADEFLYFLLPFPAGSTDVWGDSY